MISRPRRGIRWQLRGTFLEHKMSTNTKGNGPRAYLVWVAALILVAPCLLTATSILVAGISAYSQIRAQVPEGASSETSIQFGYNSTVPVPVLIGVAVVMIVMFVCGLILLTSNYKKTRLQKLDEGD